MPVSLPSARCLITAVTITVMATSVAIAQEEPPGMTKLARYRGLAEEWVEPEVEPVDHGPAESIDEDMPVWSQPQGALSGRIVYTCGGHGWTFNNQWPGEGHPWYTQRGDNNELVEDLGNADQLPFFVEYAFNAGATVVPFRPVGQQDIEVVLDNDDLGVTFAGRWSDSVSDVYFGDADDAVPYRFATASAAGAAPATARYTPQIPRSGYYPVYCWARDGDDRANDQLYRVRHAGGITEVRVNHRLVGKGWIYLGTYFLERGRGGWVEISNDSSDTSIENPRVIADAIRFGNGMGDMDRGAGVSGYPRADEAAFYWIARGIGQGTNSWVYDLSGMGDEPSNVGSPARMAAHMNRETQGEMVDRVYLGFHTNAYDPGTIGLLNGNNVAGTDTPNQARWAELIAAETNDDLSAIGAPPLEHPWPNRRERDLILVYDRGDIEFGEINNDRIGDEFDATIIEAAAHGNPEEADLMLDPKARRWVARSCLQATVRYFHEFGNGPLALLPEPPTDLAALCNEDGSVTIRWTPPSVDGIGGDAPTGYRVQRSHSGRGFDGGVLVEGGDASSTTLTDVDPGEAAFYRVVSFNEGGWSLPSETVAVRPASETSVLIVCGFDRFDRTLCVRQTTGPGIGGRNGGKETFSRVWPRRMNAFNYAVQAANAIEDVAPGVAIDTCQNEAVSSGVIDLGEYNAVIWLLGRESVADETLSEDEQGPLAAYLASGGNLFISGADIGWDLGRSEGSTPGDRRFLQHMLHAELIAHSSGAFRVSIVEDGPFGGLDILQLDDGTHETYAALESDVLRPVGDGAQAALTYDTASGETTAAITWDNPQGDGHVVLFGFPFETILTPEARAEVMERVLRQFELI